MLCVCVSWAFTGFHRWVALPGSAKDFPTGAVQGPPEQRWWLQPSLSFPEHTWRSSTNQATTELYSLVYTMIYLYLTVKKAVWQREGELPNWKAREVVWWDVISVKFSSSLGRHPGHACMKAGWLTTVNSASLFMCPVKISALSLLLSY